MKAILSLLLLMLVGCSTMLLVAPSSASAQDDSYHMVKFLNESGKPVEVKYWNPRGNKFDSGLWTIEAGKTIDFADKDGKKLSVGIYSSQITVNGGDPQSIGDVSKRSEDGSVVTITWTAAGFKEKAKSAD